MNTNPGSATLQMRMPMTGKLIVIEGPDDVGKTSLTTTLVEVLQEADVPAIYYPFPGKAERTLGGIIYDIHHEPQKYVDTIDPASNQILHVAAHVDAINRVILPALKGGFHVILDRFWWSTYVYGMEYGVDEEFLLSIIRAEQIVLGRQPDLAVLVERENDNSEIKSLAGRYVDLVMTEMAKYTCIVHDNNQPFTQSVISFMAQVCGVLGVSQIPVVSELALPEV